MKRRLDLGDGGIVAQPAAVPPAPRAPEIITKAVDLKGEKQLMVYTYHLSRLICPACNERGLLTQRVNSMTTAFICQHCHAYFEISWTTQLNSMSIEVTQMEPCSDCFGSGGVSGQGFTRMYCPKCQGTGKIALPK